MRKVIVMLEVDDDRAINEDLGTIEYLEREFGWLVESGIFLKDARILDDDDKYDTKVIKLSEQIFKEAE
jgi:hypothetical protein